MISPLLDAAEQAKGGEAAIDLRLGFEFCLVAPSSVGAVSEFAGADSSGPPFDGLYRREYVPFGAHLVIHPHQFILAQSLEYLRLPPDLMAYVVGRSTWGRLGLIVATAVGIHPQFAGNLTLELRNLGEAPLALFPGQTIAQVFFHTVEGPADVKVRKRSNSQYIGALDLIPRRISSGGTRATLEKLVGRYDSATAHELQAKHVAKPADEARPGPAAAQQPPGERE